MVAVVLCSINALAEQDQHCPNEALYLSQQLSSAPLGPSFSDACFVDNLENQEHRLIVDIRSASQFQRTYVLNTVNLPEYELIAKRQLAGRSLLIVGEAQDRYGVGQLCARLQQSGFEDVKILLGGVRALIEAGGRSNKPSGFNELTSLGARDIMTELFHNQITLVAASASVTATLPELNPLFEMVLDVNSQAETLKQLLTRSQNTRFPLVIVETETDYQAIRHLFNSVLPPNVYLADGGPGAVQHYIRTNKQIQLAMKSVPNRYKCST